MGIGGGNNISHLCFFGLGEKTNLFKRRRLFNQTWHLFHWIWQLWYFKCIKFLIHFKLCKKLKMWRKSQKTDWKLYPFPPFLQDFICYIHQNPLNPNVLTMSSLQVLVCHAILELHPLHLCINVMLISHYRRIEIFQTTLCNSR